MTKSMTGYGKAEYQHGENKYIIEFRSLNGKNADIAIKTQLVPRSKEMELRQYISKTLNRGNIDMYITLDTGCATTSSAKKINTAAVAEYLKQIREMESELHLEPANGGELLQSLLKMPEVMETAKDEITEDDWGTMFECIKKACAELDAFRLQEGQTLKIDLCKRIELIKSFVDEVEKYEVTRVETIKQRILAKIAELQIAPDENRLEQELIYYLEKLDITEEKVRLRQHCNYYLETLEKEEFPGKKLGFIAQEIGREINTMGSKSNNADMQQIVVKMKDELEKIKEQSLNIL